MALGAEGVWCGSVWLTTNEAETSPTIREKFLAATSADTLRSRSLTGKPARMLRSAWTDAWQEPDAPAAAADAAAERAGRRRAAPHPPRRPQGRLGARKLATYFVGQVVGQMNTPMSARRVVAEMIEEFVDAMERMNGLLGTDA